MRKSKVHKLTAKRYRKESGEFIVEGKKNVLELLTSTLVIERIYTTLEASSLFDDGLVQYRARTGIEPEIHIVSEQKLITLGTLKTNNAGLAVVRSSSPLEIPEVLRRAQQELILVLDDVRDPGNLGTIMRTADWFGISLIVVSPTTVDAESPKVIAASMGSFTRVRVVTTDLERFLSQARDAKVSVLGAFLEGTSVTSIPPQDHGLLLMGSESHGISPLLRPYVSEHVTIPRYGYAESLNVSVATAIILAFLKR